MKPAARRRHISRVGQLVALLRQAGKRVVHRRQVVLRRRRLRLRCGTEAGSVEQMSSDGSPVLGGCYRHPGSRSRGVDGSAEAMLIYQHRASFLAGHPMPHHS